jgi:hypothetical protein
MPKDLRNPFAPIGVSFDIRAMFDRMGIPYVELEYRPREMTCEVVVPCPMEIPKGLTDFIDFSYGKQRTD